MLMMPNISPSRESIVRKLPPAFPFTGPYTGTPPVQYDALAHTAPFVALFQMGSMARCSP